MPEILNSPDTCDGCEREIFDLRYSAEHGAQFCADCWQRNVVQGSAKTPGKPDPDWPDARVSVAQLRAMLDLLFPEEITPTARRQLERLCQDAEGLL